MTKLLIPAVARYLGGLVHQPVRVCGMRELGESTALKSYGYGTPVRIDYEYGGETKTAVLHTSKANRFGHEHMADRAHGMLLAHDTFGRLPQHVRSLDVGAFRADGELMSVAEGEEYFLLSEYADGKGYQLDLERIRDTDVLTELDLRRAQALCTYLIDIHRKRGSEPSLYTRRIRELVGHGECIMGLIDSYPSHPLISGSRLAAIEQQCVRWRWKLKGRTHRLRQVHGDFHPWNILFDEGAEFRLLDRSRGEWGEAADDVTCLTANYLFFSVQRFGRLQGALATLFQQFWRAYFRGTGDEEMREVAAPFFAFRGLVMANPLWYPELPERVREGLLSFVESVLREAEFDPEAVNEYLT